jgi:hypothetical protein
MPVIDEETVAYCPHCDWHTAADQVYLCECGGKYCYRCARPTDDPHVKWCRDCEQRFRDLVAAAAQRLQLRGMGGAA